MKKKIYYTLSIIVLLFIINLEAQPLRKTRTEMITENCYNSLTHKNNGVCESAIFVSMQFKNKFPSLDYEKFIDALNEIAKNSNNPVISYKAQLAKLYFKNVELFANVEIQSIKDENLVFEEIAKRINNIMVAKNN